MESLAVTYVPVLNSFHWYSVYLWVLVGVKIMGSSLAFVYDIFFFR